MEAMRSVEDIYALSPMQQGMLFHSLSSPESGVYVEQTTFTLEGDLDAGALQEAWRRVALRHPVLRTLVLWERRPTPLQVVRRDVRLPWTRDDWRGLPAAGQEARLEAYLRSDRSRGFRLGEAPLMRFALFHLDERAHQVVWSFHHLLLDGWSSGLVLREVTAIYLALLRGDGLDLPPARPYREFIAWLSRLDGGEAERFWRGELAGLSTPTSLGIDRPSGAADGDAGGGPQDDERLDLGPALGESLRCFARRNQLTLNALVQGAWAILLGRYSGEEDVLFGTTVSGRPAELPGVEGMVGLFINTLPVRARVSPEARVLPWLRELQERQVERLQHQHSGLVEVQGWSEVPRGRPLFESLLVFDNYPDPDPGGASGDGTDLAVTRVRVVEQTSFPLTLLAVPGPDLSLRVLYDSRRFERVAIARMLGHMRVLLESMAGDPGCRLSDLPLLTGPERRRLLVEWSGTVREHPPDACVHRLIEAQAARTPDAAAAVLGAQEMTYRQLDARADRLADGLRAAGVRPGAIAAILLDRSLETLVSILAVLKAAGACLPLDPGYPDERLRLMLEDSGATVLLTRSSLAGRLPRRAAGILLVDQEAGGERPAAGPSVPLVREAAADDLAYVVYTSGSTGRPKGVGMPHRALVNLLEWQDPAPARAARTLQFASPSFDVYFQEVLSTLRSGGTLVLAPDDARLDPRALARLMEERAIERAFLPNVVLQKLAEELRDRPVRLASLREIFVAGEQLRITPPIVSLFSRLDGCALHNHYGPSETHVATSSTLRGDPSAWPALPPIGRPIANVRAFVLDALMRPVPAGLAGELYLGGEGLARGYVGRPDLTAERFVPDPFGGRPGVRLYRTGDVCRWSATGEIEFLGRADDQVKVRGVRVEPGEIEAVLERHPAVLQAAVAAPEDGAGGRRLVAYVTRRPGLEAAAPELRAFLRERLPEAMVPSEFLALEAMPLTPSGKVDRRALPAPEAAAPRAGTTAPPRTPVEEVVEGVWSQVLGVERAGIHASFFDLGGHSLLASQVIARLRDAFGVELPMRRLFASPTIAGLAAAIDEERRGRRREDVPPIRPARRDGALPLSFAQERLWFLDQLEPGSSFYNIAAAVRLEGPLRAAALERSLARIVLRHEALRTTFGVADGRPVQVIGEPGGFRVATEDLRSLPAPQREAEALRLAQEQAERPFDLARDPLLRAALIRLDDDDHVLLLVMHHIVADAWSMGIFVRELAAQYGAEASGTEPSLPELQVQYADFAVWQREWLRGGRIEAQLRYWKERLAGAPPFLELPADRPRPPEQTFRGASRPLELPAALAASLRDLSRRNEVTLFMTLLAGFQAWLQRYTGQDDVVVGVPVANRGRVEVEDLIGFFVNTLPLRTDLSGDPTVRELLARVREVALGAHEHQDLPFERLVEELRPERDPSRAPVFQVMFDLQGSPAAGLELPGLAATLLPLETRSAKFDLTMSLAEGAGGLEGLVEYNADLFDGATIDRMSGHFGTLLEGMAARPEARLSEIPMMEEAERRRVVVEFNETRADGPAGACFHERFEAQAARAPGALAVAFGEERVAYGDLNRRANRLAHHLRTLGVAPESLVGIYLERSIEMVVTILAVLKAGGAYLPLDPAYPEQRLARMLDEARPEAVVTVNRLTPALARSPAAVVTIDAGPAAPPGLPEANPVSGVAPDNLAYVIFTSGSTGGPKGVLLTHRGLANVAEAQGGLFEVGGGSRILQFSSLGFDAAIFEIVLALGSGSTLCLAPQDALMPGPSLLHLLREQAVSVLVIPPSALAAVPVEPILSLRTIAVAGEACPADLPARWCAGRRFLNLYGPTEGTIWATAAECSGRARRPPIGRPIANVRAYVLDRWSREVPIGVPGELHLGGEGVARGYLGHPDRTAESFVPDPFAAEPGARTYRTGDRARFLADGSLEFLGRLDDQIKIRGLRIEPGEIEEALAEHPAVREVVVAAREDGAGGPRLVAYLVCPPGEAPSSSELRDHLRLRIPAPSIPSSFVVMDALPRTPAGKLDRRALPDPERAGAGIRADATPPRTALEEVLAAIWAEALGVPSIGVHDDFFDLGGHSLLAARVQHRMREVLQVEIPLRRLFDATTVAALAALVIADRPPGQAERIARIVRRVETMSAAEIEKALGAPERRLV